MTYGEVLCWLAGVLLHELLSAAAVSMESSEFLRSHLPCDSRQVASLRHEFSNAYLCFP